MSRPVQLRHFSMWEETPSRTSARKRLAIAALAFLALLIDRQASRGQPTQSDVPTPPVIFRQIFVPADNLTAWPREGEKYLPIESREFDTLITAANRDAADSSAQVAIQSAEYAGRLEGDRLIVGRGKWVVALRGDAPILLPLQPMSLVIQQPLWSGSADEPVRLGAWGESRSPAERLGLEVPRSGTLEFHWHATLQEAPHRLETVWRLPAAMNTRLILDLPAGKQPAIHGGIILDSQPLPASASRSPGPYRRWTMALNSLTSIMLQILDGQFEPQQAASSLTLRDNIAYHVTERGVEIVADLHIEEAAADFRELTFTMPPDVRLLSAVAEGRELVWRAFDAESSTAASVLVELPKLPARRSLTVTLRAWQPLVTNRLWRLPKLRPQHAFWTSGTIELSLAPMLDLQRVAPTDCVQTAVSQPTQARAGEETLRFAAYAPEANIELLVTPQAPDVTARLGSSLALTELDLSGRLTTQLDVTRGSLHTISGELASGWIPESVETTPADALGEWFVDRRNGRNTIEIQFTRAAEPDRSVTVVVAGRLQLPGVAGPITRDALRMVSWNGATVAKHLLTFQATEPYAAERIGDLPVVDPDSMLAKDRALLDPAAVQEPVFDLTHIDSDVGLRVAINRGQYEADIRLDASCDTQQLQQICHLVVRPSAGRIDRILAFATQPLGDAVRWTEQPSAAPLAAERVMKGDPRRANLPADGELWLLRLPHSTAKTVEIAATWSTAWSPLISMPLISLPEAVEQRGRVLVRGQVDTLPEVSLQRMRSIPLPSDRSGDQMPVRLAYRYEPAECQTAGQRPGAFFQPNSSHDIPTLIARRVELESFFSADGAAVHRATYDLEYNGADEVGLRLPAGAELESMTLNGRSLEISVPRKSPGAASIRFPARRGAATVTAFFRTRRLPLAVGSELPPPLVKQDFPVLTGEWTVWLPAEFTAYDKGLVGADDDLNWRQRLFGPLGRARGTQPFNPLRSSDWVVIPRSLPRWVTTLIDRDRDLELPTAALREQGQQNDAQRTTPAETIVNRTTVAGFGARASDDRPLAGWRSYHTSFVAGPPNPVLVAHPPVSIAWGTAALLFCIVVGNWLWQHRSRLAVMALAVTAVGSLWLPEVFAAVATGALLGLLAALLADWTSFATSDDSITKTWNMPFAIALIAFAFLVGVGSLSLAQTPGDNASNEVESTSVDDRSATATPGREPPAPPQIHRVLIPTGEDGHQKGNKVYVSERFLRQLTQNSQYQRSVGRQWVLIDADYRGPVRERVERDGIGMSPWTLIFEVEVLARDTTIVLPLVRAEADWAETATLDGIPAMIDWQPDGRSCAMEVAEPGRYQLALSCLPRIRESDGHNRIALSIPPIPGASIHLDHPEGMTGLRVVEGAIAGSERESSGQLTQELDDSGRLVVDWRRAELPVGNASGLRVSELRWLRVAPDDVVLETKYIVAGGGRRPETLTVEFDDRWRLMPGSAAIASDRAAPRAEGRQTVRVPLPPDDIDRQEVHLRWRLGDAEPFGRVRLPGIELTSLPVTQRWLAISSDPKLKCELTSDNGASAGTANEFLSMWGDSDSPDESPAVFTDAEAHSLWMLSVQPRATAFNVDQTTQVAAGTSGLRVQYEAQVTPNQDFQFQLPLQLSPDIVVDDITLTQAGRQVPLRWARDSTRSVNIFFSQRLAESYRLTLRGHVPRNESAAYRLPRISVAADVPPGRLQLYREPGVLLEVRGMSDYPELENNAVGTAPPQWEARRVSAYQLDAMAFDRARLAVSPNHPRTKGQTLTALFQEREAWWTSFSCHLTVEAGVLDEWRLRVSASWARPLDLQSDVPATLEKLPADKNQSLLVVRFARSMTPGQAAKIQIRGPLASEPNLPLSLPQVVSDGDSNWRHFGMVPASVGGQSMTWTDVGVRPADLPAQFTPPAAASPAPRTFEIVARPFQVVLRPAAVAQSAATVRLADTTCMVGEAGGRLIVTRLVVISHGLTDCVLQLPVDQQLVGVNSDGSPVPVHRSAESRWRLPLGPAHLPQFLEIVSRSMSKPPRNGGPLELIRPTLLVNNKPIPVEMSLWSFAHPWKSARTAVNKAAIISAADQAALRLDRFVSISEAATTMAVESPMPDGHDWYYRWVPRLIVLREQALATTTQFDRQNVVPQVVPPSTEQLTRASQRLDAWIERCDEVLTWPDPDPAANSLGVHKASADWATVGLAGNEWVHCVAEGGNPRLVVDLIPSTATPRQVQVAGLLAILALTVTAVSLMRVPAAGDALRRWPHAFAFLGGLAYWAWLWPSWLGLVIAAGSLLLVFRPVFAGRSSIAEGSTVLRRSRSL